MVNQQTLQGNWNEFKGKIRSKWGQLTNDELQSFDGNVERLVGMIQRKTGEGREAVEKYLNELTSQGGTAVSQATETVKEYAQQASERLQQTSKQASEAMNRGREEAERLIKQNPVESVGVVFGTGLLVGVLFGLMVRGR